MLHGYDSSSLLYDKVSTLVDDGDDDGEVSSSFYSFS
jgi:hypothetical protein